MHHNLTHITLTGVDERTNLVALEALSERYPLVEWGILYSPKRQGQGGRYPSVALIERILATHAPASRLALHICGSGVQNLLDAAPCEIGLVRAVEARGGRVQLNFNQTADGLNLDAMAALLDRFQTVPFITQHNHGNSAVWTRLSAHTNHRVLFDASGGRGVEPESWPVPIPNVLCGYAGGLGPDNLHEALPAISAAAQSLPFWIDMEGKLRTEEDVFDLTLAESALKAASNALCLLSMSDDEVQAAVRFCDTCDDGEGYDVARDMMKRLEALGLVVDKKFGRFQQTLQLLDMRDALEARAAAIS